MDRYFIGLMSGTSMDSIDAALLSFPAPGRANLHGFCQIAIPAAIHSRLLLCSPETPLLEIAKLDSDMANLFAQAALEVLAVSGVPTQQVAAIGSHGQTLFHAPLAPVYNSLQFGNPAYIAEKCSIPVVADFRRRDIAAGGQGAPLAPVFHAAFFAAEDAMRCVVNIGGIANITILPKQDAPVIGFDTGPGNCLMDGWIREHKQCDFDRDGSWAASGKVSKLFLERLHSEDYFHCPPPKSTGKELFNLEWLKARLSEPTFANLSPVDIQATLAELTAITIAQSISAHAADAAHLFVCGGGAHNAFLLERIGAHLPKTTVSTSAAIGFDPDTVEAAAFAWLAKLAIDGVAGSQPSVTGARHPVVLGAIYPA